MPSTSHSTLVPACPPCGHTLLVLSSSHWFRHALLAVTPSSLLSSSCLLQNRGDTEDDLIERIKAKEHVAFPQALELVASGAISLGADGKIVVA